MRARAAESSEGVTWRRRGELARELASAAGSGEVEASRRLLESWGSGR